MFWTGTRPKARPPAPNTEDVGALAEIMRAVGGPGLANPGKGFDWHPDDKAQTKTLHHLPMPPAECGDTEGPATESWSNQWRGNNIRTDNEDRVHVPPGFTPTGLDVWLQSEGAPRDNRRQEKMRLTGMDAANYATLEREHCFQACTVLVTCSDAAAQTPTINLAKTPSTSAKATRPCALECARSCGPSRVMEPVPQANATCAHHAVWWNGRNRQEKC